MSEEIKLIFLDIDNVLNTESSISLSELNYPESHLNKSLIKYLNQITDAVDAKIVISSSWRTQFDHEELVCLLNKQGITGEIIGKTPYYSEQIRAYEIISYIINSKDNITKFIILDDDFYEYEFPQLSSLKEFLVQVNYKTGLTYEDAIKAIKMLT